jgi:flavin reductase (DIM6/NTAB) family NADH-FMN oxidoreductase RutF
MELNLETDFADRAYPILASLVTPRPIALVTTINAAGQVTAAPFSFFNLLGANPPVCAFAPGDREDGTPKDTALNVRSQHEFVVNLVDEAIAEAMNQCAAALRRKRIDARRPAHRAIVGRHAAAHRRITGQPRMR